MPRSPRPIECGFLDSAEALLKRLSRYSSPQLYLLTGPVFLRTAKTRAQSWVRDVYTRPGWRIWWDSVGSVIRLSATRDDQPQLPGIPQMPEKLTDEEKKLERVVLDPLEDPDPSEG